MKNGMAVSPRKREKKILVALRLHPAAKKYLKQRARYAHTSQGNFVEFLLNVHGKDVVLQLGTKN